MKGTIITIQPHGGGKLATPVDGPPTLALLKNAIGGGWIEVIPEFDSIEHEGRVYRCVAFCDEEGKLKQQPLNRLATELWNKAALRAGGRGILLPDGQAVDVLVGQIAVVIGDDEFMKAL
jgi:hypothetical protein